jgi:RES domain-containing protein
VILWRISNHLSLAGEGALRASGRWHTRGRRIVYCAENPATALLEILVHFEIEIRDLPAQYRLLKIDAPDDLRIDRVPPNDLPKGWPENVAETRRIGDAWLADASTAMLKVPSVLVPETFNVLLNPAHPDAARVVIVKVTEHVIDPRLLK